MSETDGSMNPDRPVAHSRFPLVDRNQSLHEFETVFTSSVPSHNGCLSIEGGWGMGRTSLLNAACLTAEGAGCQVLRARGGALERDVPFGALLQIIEGVAALRNANEEIVSRIDVVLMLIRHEGERNFAALGAGLYDLLLAVRGLGPVVVAVDDADVVDDATITVLEYVYHRLDDRQIWLLTSSPPRRPGAPPLPIEHVLVNQHVRHFALTALSREGVRLVLDRQLKLTSDDGIVDAVRAATGGRPEFVVEVAKALREVHVDSGAELTSVLERLSLPRVAQGVAIRLSRVAPGARDLLEVCAVCGDTSDVATVSQLAGLDADAVDHTIDTLCNAELLQSGRPLTFVAPVVRWAVLQEITPARRSQLHARCAGFLTLVGADESAIVTHLLATEPTWNAEVAARLSAAGRVLMEKDDIELAARCLRRSLNESPVSHQDPSLWLDLAQCEIDLGLRTALSSFQKALSLGVGEDENVVQVATELMRALRSWPDLRAEGVATLQKVSSRLNDVDTELQMTFELGLSSLSFHPAQRSYGLARIESLVDGADDDSSVARAARTFVALHRFESNGQSSAADVVETFGSILDAQEFPWVGLANETVLARVCQMLLSADDFERVDRTLAATCERARSLGNTLGEDDALRLVVLSKLWQGSLDEAAAAMRRHDELNEVTKLRPLIGAAEVLLAQGQNDEATRRFGSIEFDSFGDTLERAAAHVERGRLYAALARYDEALDEYERARLVAASANIEHEALVAWRVPTIWALTRVGRWVEARSLATDHLARARAFGASRYLGTALRAMATSTQDQDERIQWLIESLKVLESSPARLETAGVMVDLGKALSDRGDVDTARTLLRQGSALAANCQAPKLAEQAGTQLRSISAPSRRKKSMGVESLTPAELRAVNLAASNVTNRAIADELFVNVKTVEGHLSRAYRKLGVTSRFELANVLNASPRPE